MTTVLTGAPLLWTVLPVPWSARGAAPALVSLAIGAVALWRFGPRRRSGSTPSGPARATDRSESEREAKPGPKANPPWR
jgi:hypothetical protein